MRKHQPNQKFNPEAIRSGALALLAGRDLTTREIADGLEVSKTTAYTNLKHMRDIDGSVHVPKRGIWSLLPQGRQDVERCEPRNDLSPSLMMLMGINPYPHNPGRPVEVKSQSSGGITYKPSQSYGVADYGAFA